MKVKFNGFKNHPKGDEYHGPTGKWKKDDVKDIDEKEGNRLIADFKTDEHAAFSKA